MLLTFKLGLADKILPVISPRMFRKMKRIKLDPGSARGSVAYGVSRGPCFPRVVDPSVPIFTETGDYKVQLGPDLGDDPNNDVEATCRVRYIDRSRRRQ